IYSVLSCNKMLMNLLAIRISRRSLFSLAISGCQFLLPLALQGQIVVSDLGSSLDAAPQIQDPSIGTEDLAQAFTTSNDSIPIVEVTLTIKRLNGGDGVSVSIFSDADGVPGSFLTTLIGPSDPLAGQPFGSTASVAYTGDVNLTPNTRYWVEARTSNGN